MSFRAHALLIAILTAALPAAASDIGFSSLRGAVPQHAGWMLLAGIGLVAVGIAAFAVRRHDRTHETSNELPLGIMRSESAIEDVASSATEGVASSPIEPPAAPTVADPVEPTSSAAASVAAEIALEPAREPERSTARVEGSRVFLALQHVDLSIDVLRRHLHRERRPMPAVWLMLLDLCRTHGREQAFAEIALEFHHRFNVCMPAWDGFPPSRDDPGLEAHSRLVKAITQSWGTHEGSRLLERLLCDKRGGKRRGFTLNAYQDLIALKRASDAVLASIEEDLAEEAKLRSAFAMAASQAAADSAKVRTSALVQKLGGELDDSERSGLSVRSALEREQPALVVMLAREWSNAALAARLCEMLARGGDGAHTLSKEAAEEIELLRQTAEQRCEASVVERAAAQ